MAASKKRLRKPLRTVEGAGGVVVNGDGRILMIRHKNGTWVFPKGHIESGESKVEAAVREVEEEAGVVAAIHDPRMTWQTDYVNPQREARRITWYLLTTDATATIQREALFPEGGFFQPNAAMRKLAFDEDRAVLRGALKAAARAGLVDAEAVAKAGRVPASGHRGKRRPPGGARARGDAPPADAEADTSGATPGSGPGAETRAGTGGRRGRRSKRRGSGANRSDEAAASDTPGGARDRSDGTEG